MAFGVPPKSFKRMNEYGGAFDTLFFTDALVDSFMSEKCISFHSRTERDCKWSRA